MTDLEKFRNEQMLDPEFREYYLENKAVSDIAKAIVACRLQANLTQKEFAVRTGLSQGDISRYESGDAVPTVRTLNRIARAMGLMLKIEFVPVSLEVPSEE